MNQQHDEGPLLLTIPEASDLLGLPEMTVKQLCVDGDLPSRRLANRTWISRTACKEYAASFGGAA